MKEPTRYTRFKARMLYIFLTSPAWDILETVVIYIMIATYVISVGTLINDTLL